jgi:hypothetical protein
MCNWPPPLPSAHSHTSHTHSLESRRCPPDPASLHGSITRLETYPLFNLAVNSNICHMVWMCFLCTGPRDLGNECRLVRNRLPVARYQYVIMSVSLPAVLKLSIATNAFAFCSSNTLPLYASLKASSRTASSGISTTKMAKNYSFRTLSALSVTVAIALTLPLAFFSSAVHVPVSTDDNFVSKIVTLLSPSIKE